MPGLIFGRASFFQRLLRLTRIFLYHHKIQQAAVFYAESLISIAELLDYYLTHVSRIPNL